MATQWPVVIAQLVSIFENLPGWQDVQIYDGPPVTDSADIDLITVGYVTDDDAGTYSSVQDDDGYSWAETGTIRSQLTCQTGDTDLPGMRVRLFELADVFEQYVRDDRRLGGVLSPEGTTELSTQIVSVQDGNGAAQKLVLTLTYFTVT